MLPDLRRSFLDFLIVATMSLSACSEYDRLDSETLALMGQSQEATEELRLAEAVLQKTAGHTRDEAIAILENDGAECFDATCRWRAVRAESFITFGVRPAGPPRTWQLEWEVVLLSSQVVALSDIRATVTAFQLR